MEKYQVLIPYDAREAITVRQAAKIARRSESTVRLGARTTTSAAASSVAHGR